MEINYKSILQTFLGVTLASLGAGCNTVKHSAYDINRIDKSNIVRGEKMAAKSIDTSRRDYISPVNSLSYDETKQILNNYRFLSPLSSDLYFGSTNGFSVKHVDLQGPRNADADKLNDLENLVKDNLGVVKGLNIGSPDSKFKKAREYQVSDNAQLLGVRNYSATETNSNVNVVIEGHLHELGDNYRIAVKFGTSSFSEEEKTLDTHLGVTTVADLGIGFWAAGPIGSAAFSAHNFIEYGIANLLSEKVPNGTSLTENANFVSSLPLSAAHTTQLLNDAHRLGATQIIIVPYDNGANGRGVGVALTKNAKDIEMDGNVLKFKTQERYARWLDTALHLSKAAIVLGIDKDGDNIISTSSGVTGGDRGGPVVGGNVSGGDRGGVIVR